MAYRLTFELSPCPFCGGEGVIEWRDVEHVTFGTVGCETPGCRSHAATINTLVPEDDVLQEVHKWNRRPDSLGWRTPNPW